MKTLSPVSTISHLVFDWVASDWRYHRPNTDSRPMQVITDGDKKIVTIGALGVRKEDIRIEKESDVLNGSPHYRLNITGETKNPITNSIYSVGASFNIDPDTIDNIEYTTMDGVLIITIKFKKTEKLNFDINMK